MLKQLPSGLYFVAIILFFTPWWSAGCANQKIISFTGVQTVTGFNLDTVAGMTPTSTNPFGMRTEKKEIPPDPFVVVALLLALGALVAGLIAKRNLLFGAGGMGFVAGVLLLVFKARVDAAVLEEGKGVISVVFENGFWGTLILLFLAAISQILIAKQLEPEPAAAPDVAPDLPSAVKREEGVEIKKRSRAQLIPTEPPPSKMSKDLRFMPPSMRAELEKRNKA
jgi:hypothetical protein